MIRYLKLPALPVFVACALCQLSTVVRADPATDKTAPMFSDPVVATGKGFEIKRSQVDDAFINYSASVAANGSSIPDGERATVRSQLLDSLIVNKVLLQNATPADKTAVAKLVDEEISTARSNSPAAFDAQLKSKGVTLAQVRDQEMDKLLARRVLVDGVTNGITIPDADVKKFYQDHPSDFEKPERVRAAHILISTQDPVTHEAVSPDQKKAKMKLATEIKARADKGEDFAALAKQYSDDPGSKDSGGEYTFPKGKMVPEFEAAAFSMKVNQISDLVETKFGYHIIKLLEKFPSSTVDFAKAEPDIRTYLIEQQAKKNVPAFLDKLKAAADVKILDKSGAAKDSPAPAAK